MSRVGSGLGTRMKRLNIIIWIVSLLVLTAPILAQDSLGAGIVETALAAANENCDGLGRDQACYGHALLFANLINDAEPFAFEGDKVNLTRIQSLKLSGLDTETGTWGVAMMALRANLSSAQPENITVLAFGDVLLENAVLPPTSAEVQVQTQEYVNVRLGPSTQVGVAGVLAPGQTVTALERLADTSWVRVRLPEGDNTGWLLTDLISTDDDLQTLNVAERTAPYYEPMQAFYFQSGADAAELTEVPESGLIIQTPEGVGEVQLLINEINIQLGSTVYFRATPGEAMTIATLEGHADVNAFGSESTAFAGTQVSVSLDENMRPVGAPSAPEPYDEDMMRQLPINNLGRAIEVSPAQTVVEIQTMLEEQAIQNGNAAAGPANALNNPAQCCPANSSEGGDGVFCPGQSCEAPPSDGTCPGNSCGNPGQGNTPGQGNNPGQGNSGNGSSNSGNGNGNGNSGNGNGNN